MAAERQVEAGVAALAAGRWPAARDAFQAAVVDEPTARGLAGLGAALWWLGETRRSMRCLEQAYAQARGSADLVVAVEAALGLAVTHAANYENLPAARGWVGRAERLLTPGEPGPLHGYAWLVRAYVSGDPDHAAALAERALGLALALPDRDLELLAMGDLGMYRTATGRSPEGLALLDEAMAGALAGDCERLDTVVFVCCDMLVACDHAADVRRAAQWCAVAEGFAGRYGCPFLLAQCRILYGSTLVKVGQWDRADEVLTGAIRAADGCPEMASRALAGLAELRLRQGRPEEAAALLPGTDDPAATLALARLSLADDQPALAAALLRRWIAEHGEHRRMDLAPALGLLVEAQLALSRAGPAAEVAGRLRSLATVAGDYPSACADLAAAAVAATGGRSEDAVALLESAAAGFGRLGMPWDAARARHRLGVAAMAADRDYAVGEATAALNTFVALGAATDAEAAAALLRAAGERVPARRAAGRLTDREEQVLGLVALGLSNPEIAQRLFISRKTVAHHVSSVLAKLGLSSRAQAIAQVARDGRMAQEPVSARTSV